MNVRWTDALTMIVALTAASAAMEVPPPGSVYREYRLGNRGDRDWRVTDPEATHEGAKKFLPNPQLKLEIGDLREAVRAEVVIARWGGHPGTSKKRFRVNGHAWIDVPELTTVPQPLRPECVMYQDNPVVPVPLEHLREEENILEGTCSDQICYGFGWGQWGWDAIVVRIYYKPSKPHVKGRVTAPRPGAILGEDPELAVTVENPNRVARVDFLAYYEGHDEDGDGIFRDWHHAYQFNRRSPPADGLPDISGHAGTVREAPYRIRWDTRRVPDQSGIQVLARIQDSGGVWYVTEPVGDLTLSRAHSLVRFYKPSQVPERFWVRARRSMSSVVVIPGGEPLERAVEATVHLRTWNGAREIFTLNGFSAPIGGGDHVYADTVVQVPGGVLRVGENRFEFRSDTDHHGPEILWPGPSLTVRYRK